MGDSRKMTREDLVRMEAENYRERLKHKMLAMQSHKERVYEALQQRQEARQQQAQSYLDDLNVRANFRDNMATRMQQEKDAQVEFLKRQGEAYRQRLRRYLRPELLNELDGEEAGPA